jgi:hypothetical protein
MSAASGALFKKKSRFKSGILPAILRQFPV